MIYLLVSASGETKMVWGWRQVPTMLGPTFTLINTLIIVKQTWLKTKPRSLLTSFLISCASFTGRSTCPYVLSNVAVLLKSMQWPMQLLCSTKADFQCSLNLVSLGYPFVLRTFPLTHGIRVGPQNLMLLWQTLASAIFLLLRESFWCWLFSEVFRFHC
jgi:hypothetical protein